MREARCRWSSATPSPVAALTMNVAAKFNRIVERRREAEKPLASDQIDLVERQAHVSRRAASSAMMRSSISGHTLGGIDHKQDGVGLGGALPGGIDHRLIEPAPRREDSRRIDEDDLGRCPR